MDIGFSFINIAILFYYLKKEAAQTANTSYFVDKYQK